MLQPLTMLAPIQSDDGKRDSFRSYVKFGLHDQQPTVSPERDSVTSSEDGDLRLLHDELVASQCDNVILYRAFSGNVFGKLFCTNFRLCFIPTAEAVQDPCCSRSLIMADQYEVPLCAIESMSYSSSVIDPQHLDTKKFRPLTSSLSTLDIVSCLKVVSKDFRVFLVDFQKSQFAVALVNQILHFSRPSRITNLFQLACFIPPGATGTYMPLFNTKRDWETELKRCRISTRLWRYSYFNGENGHSFSQVDSYPECVVVPADMFDYHLEKVSANWNEHRFPVWVWSSPDGCSLLRSSDSITATETTEQLWNMVFDQVARAHPQGRLPVVVDVGALTKSKILEAYNGLLRLCTIADFSCKSELVKRESQYASSDNQWYTSLNATNWCHQVHHALMLTRDVMDAVLLQKCSVIIKEMDGFDMAPLVSSVAQICLDPFCRTFVGFGQLVQKEWSTFGHPFGLRLFGADSSSNSRRPEEVCPVFLLFLDCVAQLLYRFEADFEFSHIYLVSLWDLAITGLTTTFSCSSVKELCSIGGKRCDAFPLTDFYSAEHGRLFANLSHSATRLLNTLDLPSSSGKSKRPVDAVVLWPPNSMAEIRLWSDCYMRWTASNTEQGGSVVADGVMADLCVEIAQIEGELCGDCSRSTDLWPFGRHPSVMELQVTSAYPWSKEPHYLHSAYAAASDNASVSSSSSKSRTLSSPAAAKSFVQPMAKHYLRPAKPLAEMFFYEGSGKYSPRAMTPVASASSLAEQNNLRLRIESTPALLQYRHEPHESRLRSDSESLRNRPTQSAKTSPRRSYVNNEPRHSPNALVEHYREDDEDDDDELGTQV